MTRSPREETLREGTLVARWSRAAGGVLLAALAWLFVGAAMTPFPGALAEGAERGESVRFVDRNGELLREVRAKGDQARATWVSLDDMGEVVPRAVLAAEDARFYEHVGVDPVAVLRAVVTSVRARRVVSGASTLSMQLARVVVPHRRDLRGKLGEMALAVRIEASLSKREILEQYLNRVTFAGGVRGIGAASRTFFDKPPRALSLAEAATLTGLPRGPSYYSLLARPERAIVRRDRVLGRMVGRGMIDRDAHARGVAEPLTLQLSSGGFGAPHLTDALMAGTFDRAVPAVAGRANLVETTVDRRLQREVEVAAGEAIRPLASRNVTAASVLVVENATGEVLAYVGAPDWRDDARGGKNDGVRALRQPGSTLKPFVYGLAMEDLGWTPATIVSDTELHFATPSGPYSPRNYDERFHGDVRVREALGNSYNVPAVRAADEVGVARLLDRLREVGLSSLERDADYYGHALALGDGEVRLRDLVGAYSVIARGGVALPLVATRGGDRGEPRRVMSAASAAMIADILADRSARLAAFGEHSVLELPFPVAAKTGTSKGYRDNWTVGFTREVTVGVWVGNFDGSPMRGVSGITGAGPLFRVAMEAAMRGREASPSAVMPSDEVARARVCAASGDAAGSGCPHVLSELVPRGRALAPCARHGHGGGASEAGTEGAPRGASVRVRYPYDGARFFLDPARPIEAQSIPLEAEGREEARFFVDGEDAGVSRPGARRPAHWRLRRGAHVIVAESRGHRSPPVRIHVD